VYTKTFLYWRCVLASSMVLHHRFLSSGFVFHPRTPRIVRSLLALPSYFRLGLSPLRVPSGFEKVAFLHGDVSSTPVRCPGHLSLPSLTILTISGTIIRRTVHNCTQELRYERLTLYRTVVFTYLFS
jgi:hypothetical protein